MDFSALIHTAEQELSRRDKGRNELIAQVNELKRASNDISLKPSFSTTADTLAESPLNPYISSISPTEDKIALFRSLYLPKCSNAAKKDIHRSGIYSGFEIRHNTGFVNHLCHSLFSVVFSMVF